MNVEAIRTHKIVAGKDRLKDVVDKYLPRIEEGSVLAITSKIVSLCENRVVETEDVDRDELINGQAEYYNPVKYATYGHRFTIAQGLLSVDSGIDESNADGQQVLWPADPQSTANQTREYLSSKFRLRKFGVVITDSTCTPLRWGTTGVFLAHSGFAALNDYIGQPDLFGLPFKVSKASVAGGLAAAAVLVMGEGGEQTPMALVDNLPFVSFQNRNPRQEELENLKISRQDDLFAPFLNSVEWLTGGGGV